MGPSKLMHKKLSEVSDVTRRRCLKFVSKLSRKDTIGQVALREGMIDHRQLGAAVAKQREIERQGTHTMLGEILIDDNALTKQNFELLITPMAPLVIPSGTSTRGPP